MMSAMSPVSVMRFGASHDGRMLLVIPVVR